MIVTEQERSYNLLITSSEVNLIAEALISLINSPQSSSYHDAAKKMYGQLCKGAGHHEKENR